MIFLRLLKEVWRINRKLQLIGVRLAKPGLANEEVKDPESVSVVGQVSSEKIYDSGF